MTKLGKVLTVFAAANGAMVICLTSELLIGNFVGKGISFLMFPINFILCKGILTEKSK